MQGIRLIAESVFDVAEVDEKLCVRMYAPDLNEDGTWVCRVEIGAPIGWSGPTYGASAIQALALGVKTVAMHLYASVLWKEGKLGVNGKYGGYLGIPAPTDYLDFAPFPF